VVAESYNEITGNVTGAVVQAGSIGSVHLSAPVPVALAGLPAEEGFTGRDDDLSALAAVLAPDAGGAESVLVSTVAGLAGVGKTALAVRAAHRAVTAGWFAGGVLFMDLHGYDPAGRVDASAAVGALLGALGVGGERIPPSQGEREALYRSELAAMAGRGERVLVVADNASSLEQVLALRPGSPMHRMVVTSRHTLPVPGARRVEVDVLPEGEAIAVLAQALRAAHPGDERIIAEPDAAAELVRSCGYLPLALRIVAELLADRPAQPIADWVKIFAGAADRLGELAYGDSVAVRVAFDASYRNLPAGQARVFRLAALHPGPHIGLAAVAALAGVSEAAGRRLLDGIRRAHLIQHAAAREGYQFHDLLRLYASQRCEAEETSGERDAAISRLLEYYRETTRAADTHLNPRVPPGDRSSRFADRPAAVAWLEDERPNLVAVVMLAARAGRDRHARDISLALSFFFNLRKHWGEWITTAGYALAAARRLGDRHGEGTALNSLGVAYCELRRWDEALGYSRQALTIYREIRHRPREARALTNLGNAYHELRRFDDALGCYWQALTVYREVRDAYGEAQTLNNLGLTYGELRRFDNAVDSYEQALGIFREVGDRHDQGVVLTNLGASYRELCRFDEALDCHQQALAICRETGDEFREARTLANLGSTYQDVGRLDEALGCHQQALDIFREVDDHHGQGVALTNLGTTYQALRRGDDALDCYRQALVVFAQANAAYDAERVSARIAELARPT
jgi:tetratricopeptide (TPR) repeat protein